MSFKSLQVIEPILEALAEEGYSSPTPIQQKAIPIVLNGDDLLGCAQTGTGKTAAFAIPIIQILSQTPNVEKRRKIRSLIVTPTRELAIQIGESFDSYGRHTKINNTVIFGGVKQGSQTNILQNGVDVLIATPGRLLDLISQGFITLKFVELFVLDEADRMLDMGFVNDVKRIIAQLPKHRQSLFFSATMPPEIQKLADTILVNPKKVEVTPVSSTAEKIKQKLFFVDKNNKLNLLLHVLKDDAIRNVLVFTTTKHGADRISKKLNEQKITSDAIHGNKSQNARQRALSNFKEQKTRVLVATDIAARGIDIDELEFVINYEIPNVPETYVHRIGRTGRAGARGTSLSFCDALEKAYWKDIERLMNKKVEVVDGHPFPLVDHNPEVVEKQRFVRSNKPSGNKPKAKPSGNSSAPKRRN